MGCDMFTLIRHIIIYKKNCAPRPIASCPGVTCVELELELILSQMAQKPMLRVGGKAGLFDVLRCALLVLLEGSRPISAGGARYFYLVQ